MWIGFHGGFALDLVSAISGSNCGHWENLILKGVHSADQSMEDSDECCEQNNCRAHLDVKQISITVSCLCLIDDIVHGKNSEAKTEEENETYHLGVHKINCLSQEAHNVILLSSCSNIFVNKNTDLIRCIPNFPFFVIDAWHVTSLLSFWEGFKP